MLGSSWVAAHLAASQEANGNTKETAKLFV
jgi:hypothetical protein